MIIKPKGTEDIIFDEAKKVKYIERLIDEVMEKYNYNYIETPIFENTSLFKRSVGKESDIVTKETYDFVDRGNRSMTLRPEGTASIVRSYIENKMQGEVVQPVKLYYNGPMFRYERPQAGRDRQFSQFGVEVIGSNDPMVDAEVISLGFNIFKLLGLNDVVVNINSLGDKESRINYKKKLVDYFTPHIDSLCDDCKRRIDSNPLRILDCKVDADSDIIKNAPSIIDSLNDESRMHFEKVKEYLDIMQVPYKVNPNIVRGLDYYDHTVFEFVCSNKALGNASVIGGGGRYNSLIKELGGEDMPAIGFASGISRVILALEKEEVSLDIKKEIDLFLLYVNEVEKNYAIYLAQELRLRGFVVETEYNSRSLKSQFKKSERLGSRFVSVLNSNDLDNNEINIKNTKTKKSDIINLDALIYYLEESDSMEEGIDLYNLEGEEEEEFDEE